MRRSVLLPALLLAIALPSAGEARAEGVAFMQGRPFAEALKRARAEKKPLMVDIYAVWCGPCKQLDRMTFADPTVGEWAKKNVVPVKVDAEKGEGRRVAIRYAVRAFPTVVFIDPTGTEIDRISGVFGPADYIRNATEIVAGRSPLVQAIEKLGRKWEPELAGSVALQLLQRNDAVRLGPIARRGVEEDPQLVENGARDAFFFLVSLEDGAEKVSPETLDLIESVAPRLAADPRVVVLHLAAAREQARRGDAAAARTSALAGLKGLPEDSPFAADLQSVLAAAERLAKRPEAALAAARKGVALGEKSGSGWSRVARQFDLAETLAFAGQPDEARKMVDVALEQASNEPAFLARASTLLLRVKDVAGAVAKARRGVEASQGGDSRVQVALGEALAASGDRAGAAEAFARAAELEPENAAVRKRLEALRPKKPSKRT